MPPKKQEDNSAEAPQCLQDPDLVEEDVTFKDYEISGLSEVSPLPPLIDCRRRTFDKISSEQRRDSEQFLIAVQKLRALPTMKGDSRIFFLFKNEIRRIELDDFEATKITVIHQDHESPVTAMTISDTDPCMVASAEMIALIHIWHPQDGTVVTKLSVDSNTKIVTCLSFCRNGRLIAVLSDASVVHIFNWIKAKHISKAHLKVGCVVDMKFASETTVAALTPKALFLCDLVGSALLPTRTLVSPGILPTPNVVLTSLTVNDKDNVIVGCSDKFLVEWSGRVAIRRGGKEESGTKKENSQSRPSTSTSPVRLVITAGKDFIYTAQRNNSDIVIQTFTIDDLRFHEEYRTPVPTESWKPSAISFGVNSLVLGAMKETPFILFDVLRKSFKVLRTDAFVDKSKSVNATSPNGNADLNSDAKGVQTATGRKDDKREKERRRSIPTANLNEMGRDELDGNVKRESRRKKIDADGRIAKAEESKKHEGKARKASRERKNSKSEKEDKKANGKESWFRKWLPN